MRVLVVAVSARMIAQLAFADGYEVTALDRFGDVDLRAIAAGATAPSNDALAALAANIDAEAIVYGGGLENRPDLVAQLSQGRELLATAAEMLDAVRDPWAIAAAARAAGARAPETRSIDDVPDLAHDAGTWLRKPRRGGGGRGVRRWMGGRLGTSEILQRRVHGLSCSAVAIADGRRATVLGITEQLHRASGFHWTGNVAPPRLPVSEHAALDGRLRAVCDEVAARFGVRGAFGVDAIWDGRDAWVLEVNPRPPAGLELFGPGSFEAHVRGARGLGLPAAGSPPATSCAKVKLVLFAPRDLRAPEPGWWPAALVRDIPHAGERIKRGAPVCTLVSATESEPVIAALGARLLAALPDAVMVRD
jgi:predicted ATP-grasp superfamily ATP-dependent carboligase